jgi:acyl carrier protein
VGLDSVELVMAFEDAFELRIADQEAGKLQTVGDVADLFTARLAADGRPLPRDRVLAMVMVITCDQLGTTLDRLTEDTSFVNDLGMS